MSYEWNGTTYVQIFDDPVGSDFCSVHVAGDLLIAGTKNWSDYALRVYRNYSLIFRDGDDGGSWVSAGDTDGDGQLEIARVFAYKGSSPVDPTLMVYDGTTFAVDYTSPRLSPRVLMNLDVDVGELLSGGGEEIVLGSWRPDEVTTPESIWIYQHDGVTYHESARMDLAIPGEDIWHVRVADLDGDGTNELYVSTSDQMLVYRPVPAAVGVLVNDADAEGDPLTAALITPPANGTIDLSSDGSFTYTPAADFHGVDTFTYVANDGQADSDVATVAITVNPVNDAPVAVADAYGIYGDTVWVGAPGVLGNDADIDGDPVEAILVDPPSAGSVVLNPDGSFTYDTGPGFTGVDTFTYKANDGIADSNVTTVTITHMLYVRNLADSGEGSLRWTIANANAHAGADTIRFVVAGAIDLASELPDLADTSGGTTIDGRTAPGYAGSPVVALQGPGAGTFWAIRITSSANEVRALQIGGFLGAVCITGDPVPHPVEGNLIAGNYLGTDGTATIPSNYAVLIRGSNGNVIGTNGDGVDDGSEGNVVCAGGLTIDGANSNVFAGNFVGTDATGTVALGGSGISVQGASYTRIGTNGDGVGDAAERNVISGNAGAAINMSHSSSSVVAGNYIGTDVTGTVALGNSTGGDIWTIAIFDAATGTRIGTNGDGVADDLERNVISGNRFDGVCLHGSGGVFAGNYVGTDASGTQALPNARSGVMYTGDNYRIGTNGDGVGDAAERNVISSNSGPGMFLWSSGAVVAGNYIGVDATGTGPLGNGGDGINLSSGDNARIGTNGDGIADEAERNVISANGGSGIYSLNTSTATVAGNYIGTDVTGAVALGNGSHGVHLPGGRVGSNGDGVNDPAERNVISANAGSGISMAGPDVTIGANYVGTDATGSVALGNAGSGIDVGAVAAVFDNLVSGNGSYGIAVSGAETSLQRNLVGTDATGTSAIGNGWDGIYIYFGASNVLVGGTVPEDGNLVAFNGEAGVVVAANAAGQSSGVTIRFNAIHSNAGPGIDLNDDGIDTNDPGDPDAGANGLQNFPAIVTAVFDGANTTVTGTLNSTPSQTYAIDLYANTVGDPTGYGEGETYLATTTCTTDASGDAAWNVVASGDLRGFPMSATATDATGNSSEFSALRSATADPVAGDDATSTIEDEAVAIDVLLNDSDVDGDPLIVVSVSDPDHGSAVINPDGSVTYTPDADFYGEDIFTYTISDGQGGTDTATVLVTVYGVNDPPVAVDDSVQVLEDSSTTINVIENDVDADNDFLAVAWSTAPSNGALVWNPDGTVTYTPNPNFHGADIFNYAVSDGTVESGFATVSITVLSVNDPPVAVNDAAMTVQRVPVDVDVLANDTDVDGGTLVLASVTQGANGTVTINPNGTAHYAPDAAFAGTDTFTYIVSDGQGGTDTGVVTVTVVPDDDGDGIIDSIEDGAANGGDGNSDGTPDKHQPNVVSLPNAVDGRYVTLVTPAGTSFTNVRAMDNPSPGDAPVGVEFPVGFFEFTVTGIARGGAVTVTLLLPTDVTVDTYYKHGPTPVDPITHWYEFLSHGTTGAEILAGHVLLHFVDGQRGDDFAMQDAQVVDVGGPGLSNQPPTVDGAGPYSVDEGTSVVLTAFGSDPDGEPLTYAWDFDGDGTFETPGQSVTFSANDLDGPSAATVAVQVTDSGGLSGTDIVTIDVLNVAPAVGTITGPLEPVQVGIAVDVTATFSDPAAADFHTGTWNWGDGSTSNGTVSEADGTVAGSHTYAAAGVYIVTVTVTDDDGDSGEAVFEYVVIYDPDGGYVTGGGWINSPEGAYAGDPTATGRANFGFNSKYKKGANVPTGQTQFHFNAGPLHFHSNVYEWLVVAEPTAKFKGDGTVNGGGEYGFLLTARDGQRPGGGGTDKFRIKIWDKTTEQVVYDNQMGESEDSDAASAIGGGSIVIHEGS